MESEDNIFIEIAKFRNVFGVLLKDALRDGLAEVANSVLSNKYIGTYYEWPSVSFNKNGLPSLSSSLFSGAKEYRKIFGNKEQEINESSIESFRNFYEYVTSNKSLENRFIMKEWRESNDANLPDFRAIFIYNVIKDAIERYIHIHSSFEFNESNANSIVDEIQNYIFWDTLPIDIVVPILFINFECENCEVFDGVEIRRLTENEHLARYKIKSYNVSVHDSVLASATHALVLKDWEVKNSPCKIKFDTLRNIRAYPIDRINNFFAAIRLVKDINTGYAQIFSLAKNWINNCKANLPYVVGTSTRSYPAILEDYYWNIEPVPLIKNSEINTIGRLFSLLCESKEKSIDLSVKRLNKCLVRDSEEDSVLDATIALEALLSDDGSQEMTHKLAMRVGALMNLDNSLGKTPQQAFADIKSIYAYRSAIVHGSKTLDKKRVIKLEDNKETTTHSLAVEYLRFVLKILIENPQYQDPKLIDSVLLLGRTRT